ncbi:MAG: hypothetical protein SF339_05255 [Blastocatellia bacterium]|nr:hypothetical protein [Blastocatellia bacterium]
MAETTYTFRNEHHPTLLAGAYKVTATWGVSVDKTPKAGKSQTADFFVAGERFSLKPADIHSAYPPEGSRGSFEDCLPHIALARDTLPWERTADGEKAPWLALLVLHESEAAQCRLQTITLEDYGKTLPAAPVFAFEPGQEKTDLVQVISLPAALAGTLLPQHGELSTLCHVRAKSEGGVDTESVAVVASCRLPAKGRNTVHLVSVEKRYTGTGFNFSSQATVTLLSLKSWSFTCEVANHLESESLERIFSEMKSAWLRLPIEGSNSVRGYLAAGFVPVPHRFRTGETGASWYAGPLAPALRAPAPDKALKFPAASADALLWYDESLGMLNIAYAAAWELGRALALQNRRMRELLQQWRRQRMLQEHARQAADGVGACGHLPQAQRARPRSPLAPPEELAAWIDGLRRLRGIPIKYLAPDERMLPRESIAFFGLDQNWIEALLDGVLSSVRTPTAYEACCREAEKELLYSSPAPVVTGFLLRSKAVAGWPGLQISAVGADLDARRNQPLELYRMEQLSPSILLCLFKGTVNSLTIRQPAETLHLELKTPGEAPALWRAGEKIWKDETGRVLDLTMLRDSSGAGFAQHFLHQQQTLEAAVQWS